MSTNNEPIRLTDEQLKLLGGWSARTGRPESELLAEALREYQPAASQQDNGHPGETFLDRLSRNGLVGCLSGGPPDLSTNPDHMVGFGE